MSNLFVVRHGQASFFAENYDQLSPTGQDQARLLGEHWSRRDVAFDQVFSGPCVRHTETARIVGQAYRDRGLDWPDPVVLAGLDEYEAEAVLKQALPDLVSKHPHIRQLYEVMNRATDQAEKLKTFQRVYEVVIDMWAHDELDLPRVESWSAFCRRMHDALAQIADSGGGGRQVVAFSSGGPVGVCVQRALGISHRHTLQLAWMVRNGAFSEFLFSGQRFTLSRFNAFPHLDAPELLTYR
jgi:broad specificity phosphatase PhoE